MFYILCKGITGRGAHMFEKMNKRVEKLTIVDIKLIKGAVFFSTIMVVKFFPQLLKIDYWILAVLLIACMVRPCYKVWIAKEKK